jgi:hypothetical protein
MKVQSFFLLPYQLVSNFLEHIPFRETNNHSASEEISHFCETLIFNIFLKRVLIPVINHMSPVCCPPPYFSETYFNSTSCPPV